MPIINMVYKKKKWWKPWANTIAYYKLDGDNTVNECSWKDKVLTNLWIIFGEYQWVDCAYFDGNSHYLYNNSSYWLTPNTSFTASVRVYYIMRNDWTNDIWYYWAWSNAVWIWGWWNYGSNRWLFWVLPWTNNMSTTQLPQNVWSNLIYVYDNSNSTVKVYKNTELFISDTGTTSTLSDQRLVLWSWDNGSAAYWKWGMSEFIIEKWIWSEQDRANYYNLTKANYWL